MVSLKQINSKSAGMKIKLNEVKFVQQIKRDVRNIISNLPEKSKKKNQLSHIFILYS